MAKSKTAAKSSQDLAKRASQEAKRASQEAKMRGEHPICRSKNETFCFVCARYIRTKSRRKFSENLQNRYKELYGVDNLKNSTFAFSGSCICSTCTTSLYKRNRRFRPAIWSSPDADHEDCFICKVTEEFSYQTLLTKKNRRKSPGLLLLENSPKLKLSVKLPDREAAGESDQMNVEDSDTDEPTLKEIEDEQAND